MRLRRIILFPRVIATISSIRAKTFSLRHIYLIKILILSLKLYRSLGSSADTYRNVSQSSNNLFDLQSLVRLQIRIAQFDLRNKTPANNSSAAGESRKGEGEGEGGGGRGRVKYSAVHGKFK
jgi:hypothetical protein